MKSNVFLKRLSFGSKECNKELKQECADFLGLISYHLIVSKFHNKTHDPKGQENKSSNTFFLSVERLARWPKKGQRLSVSTTSFFYQSFSKFHIWIASIKLSLKFEYKFCPMKVNQDCQRNGHHLLVCTNRHFTLVIYNLIAAKFHIYVTFINLSPKFEYGLCRITKMAAKWLPPVSLHLWTLLRCMSGLQYFNVFPE